MAQYFKGRGALSNPPGRFESTRTESVEDGWYAQELPESIATRVMPERSRSIISTNDSPDVPFEQSINPYRGCEHGCVYCLHGDTPILLADGTTRPLGALRPGQEIYGTLRQGRHRHYVRTQVLAHWSVVKPAYRVRLEDGTELITGPDHRFLTGRGWKYVTGAAQGPARRPHLTTRNALMGVGAFAQPVAKDAAFRKGYLCGMIRGGGALGRCAWPPAPSAGWHAGFLAGAFDAEGSYSNACLRISNTDPELIRRILEALQHFGFRSAVERATPAGRKPLSVVRVVGGLREHLRFFHSFDPVITSKRDIAGQALKSGAKLGVVAIEPLGRRVRLYDITTGTGDFIANGVVSHNCYARPSHAYMGLSPGQDFETNLFYKPDAAQLLRAELGRRSYVCKPITLGANTDPYQPVEKRLQITRQILEVMRDCRHPVTIVTKGALLLRDLDLLGELARDRLVNIMVSLTTLDPQTKRLLEPRAAAPQSRLRMIRELTAAGIPVGVLVAPIIPLINDPELEDLVAAAAQAGALRAGYVLLRLPHELKDLFREWLTEHYPLRAAHVMSLVQAMRGGSDNDPRFGARMRGTGPFAVLIKKRFSLARERAGLGTGPMPALATELFRPPGRSPDQMELGLD